MAADETTQTPPQEPRGFGQRTRGLAGEYAHEQGWGLDVEERTKQAVEPQDIDGGTDYEYGAQDFGDDPVNTSIPVKGRDRTQNTPAENVTEAQQPNAAQSGSPSKE